jgi:hypothetical protein
MKIFLLFIALLFLGCGNEIVKIDVNETALKKYELKVTDFINSTMKEGEDLLDNLTDKNISKKDLNITKKK